MKKQEMQKQQQTRRDSFAALLATQELASVTGGRYVGGGTVSPPPLRCW